MKIVLMFHFNRNLIDKILDVKSASQESNDWIDNSFKLFLDWICPLFEVNEPDSKQLTHEVRERESRRIFNRVIKEGLLWYKTGRNLDALVRMVFHSCCQLVELMPVFLGFGNNLGKAPGK